MEKEKGWTLKIDEKEADVVRMVFEYYTIGEKQEDGSMLRIGPTKIARKLDNLKIQPQKGTEWSTSTIRDMLTNPVYIGMVRWNQRARVKSMSNGQISTSRPRSKNATLAKGLHPAIIQKDTFDLAQEYIEKNPVHPAPSSYQLKNPLSGIVKCGVCGRAMARRPYQKKGKPATLMCPSTSCTNVSVALPLVEERILAGLRDWLSGYILELGLDNETDAVHKKDVMKKSLSDLAKKRGTLQKQLNKAHELLEQEVYTIETFIERSKSVSDDITEIDKTVLAIEKEIALDKAREDSKKNIVPMIENVLDVYDSLPTPTGKNNILKEILEKVVYVKKEECRWNSPDNFEITLFPKLPYAK